VSRARVCLFAVGLAGCAGSSARHQILRTNEVLFHAIADRDVAALERVVAPDFRFETQGQKGDRRAFLDGVKGRAANVEHITNEELELRLDGPRAVLCGLQRATVVLDGKRVDDQARFCDRWEERDGRWQVTFAGEPPRTP
jgi:hypothetical protein